MNTPPVRVWVEEIEPPALLRFTWKLPENSAESSDDVFDTIQAAIVDIEGVTRAEFDDDGLLVEIDADVVSRYDLAAAMRAALQPDAIKPPEDIQRIRVWAEDFTATEMRVSWEIPKELEVDGERQQRRRVAAWLSVTSGVKSASPDDEGVSVRYNPEKLDRSLVGEDVRSALDDDMPLKERADELMGRAKIYGNLARKLALDDRISPLPGAAKQAVASSAAGGGSNTVMRTAVRFVPGAGLITRMQSLLPMLTELSKWSREADPEIVESHLASVGLDRETLRRDTITAHEIRFYAKDSASETASALGDRASASARQAISAGRSMLDSFRQSMEQQEGKATKADTSERAEDETNAESERPSHPEDSSPEDPRSNSA